MKEVVRHSYKDGEISETRTLRFLPFYYSQEIAESLMMIIRNQLAPDLLTKKYREENIKTRCTVIVITLLKLYSISWNLMI